MLSFRGAETGLTRKGGLTALESPEGNWLYFDKRGFSDGPLYRMPTAGGEERNVVKLIAARMFALTERNLYGWSLTRPSSALYRQ